MIIVNIFIIWYYISLYCYKRVIWVNNNNGHAFELINFIIIIIVKFII